MPWETSSLAADFDWKKTAEPVMRLYTEATDGSSIEHKESALVWHHQEADPDFGSCQAKELLDHLENVLANEPVVVKRGQHIVEVNPQVSHARARLFYCCWLVVQPSLRTCTKHADQPDVAFELKPSDKDRPDPTQSSPHPLHAWEAGTICIFSGLSRNK